MVKVISREPPETLREARRWTVRNTQYINIGLCFKCAAQAAYGHQLGFLRANDPCVICTALVDRFPRQEAGAWRSLYPSETRYADKNALLPPRTERP